MQRGPHSSGRLARPLVRLLITVDTLLLTAHSQVSTDLTLRPRPRRRRVRPISLSPLVEGGTPLGRFRVAPAADAEETDGVIYWRRQVFPAVG